MNLGMSRLGSLCEVCEKEKASYLKGKHNLPSKILSMERYMYLLEGTGASFQHQFKESGDQTEHAYSIPLLHIPPFF